MEEHVSTLNSLLAHVSRKLFGLFEVILNSPMRVKLRIKEADIDYEMVSKSATKPVVKQVRPNPEPKPNAEGAKDDSSSSDDT